MITTAIIVEENSRVCFFICIMQCICRVMPGDGRYTAHGPLQAMENGRFNLAG